ncbi:MAG TPA: hypothetical protein DCE41_34295, partial [Cytophagales bacterium]|nr:hypothetical protein [Cytophagales bacterium]
AAESLVDTSFRLLERIIDERIAQPGVMDTTYVKVASANYLTQVDGNVVTVDFDADFTNTYAGAELYVAFSGIT